MKFTRILRDLLALLFIILPGVLSSLLYENSHYRYDVPGIEEKSEDPRFGCPEENIQCDKEALYREFDGKCNNIKNPLWGSAGIMYRRFIPAQSNDDGSNPRELPTARKIVSALNGLPVQQTSKVTLAAMQWGQFISHDINITPRFSGLRCCDSPDESKCLAIDVRNDPFYRQFDIECLENFRSISAGTECGSEREQVNVLTSYIDGSIVYGVTEEAALELRTCSYGQLKVHDGDEILQGSCPATAACPFKLLPTVIDNGQEKIITGHPNPVQQPILTSFHALCVRVHNDLAIRLAAHHYEYDDEKIYQETRQLVGALIQHITYNEYLQAILPSWALDKWDLPSLSPGSGYSKGYKTFIDASLRNAFTTAAFRFGHSLVQDHIDLKDGRNVELATTFNNNTFTFNFGTYPSDILNGVALQQSQEVDQNLVSSLSNRLFASAPKYEHGLDLYSRNILRGRDHRIPSYTQFRAYCNLPTITSFGDLRTLLRDGVANIFKLLYKSVDDIDLYPALLSEVPDGDGIVGPTLACLLSEQFRDLKFGDRFYYESNKHPNRFTRAQLDAIRRTSLGALLCRYTNTQIVPEFVMKVLGPESNLKRCEDILEGTVLTELESLF